MGYGGFKNVNVFGNLSYSPPVENFPVLPKVPGSAGGPGLSHIHQTLGLIISTLSLNLYQTWGT